MSTESTTAQYIVPEVNLPVLRTRVAELAKRAAKLGLDFPVRIVSEQHHHDTTIEHKNPDDVQEVLYVEVRRYFAVDVESAVVKLDGWRFLASIAHTTEGNIVSVVPGQSCPATYRSVRSECDHCKTYRRRLETFVVMHDDGRTMQVGRNCLVDFTGRGARDAQALAEMAQLLATFDVSARSEAWDGGNGSEGERMIQLQSFLEAVAKVIRVKGWTSRTTANEFPGLTPTATHATRLLMALDKAAVELRRAIGPTTDDDKALAAAAIAWAMELGAGTDLNDYQYNLAVIARLGVVDGKRTGLAASMIVGYQRAHDLFQRRQKEAKLGENSRYQGTEGQRLRGLDVTVAAVIALPATEWGTSYLCKFLDAAGNLYVNFTGSPQVSTTDVDTVVRIDGTVKRHETYNGTQQTTLSRVAVWTPDAIQAATTKAAKKATKRAKADKVTT